MQSPCLCSLVFVEVQIRRTVPELCRPQVPYQCLLLLKPVHWSRIYLAIVIHAELLYRRPHIHQHLLLSVINEFLVGLNIIVLVLLFEELGDFLPLERRHGSLRDQVEVSSVPGSEVIPAIVSTDHLGGYQAHSLYKRIFP